MIDRMISSYQLAGPRAEWYRHQSAGYSRVELSALSALSPRISWEKVLDWFPGVKTGTNQGFLGRSYEKARALLEGGDPEVVFRTAPKTRAFFYNLAGETYPDGTEPVTLDAHMIRAWGLHSNLTPKRYREAESLARVAAKILGVEPSRLQSNVWEATRESPSRAPPGLPPF